MKLMNIYQNFWLRNFIFLTFFITLIYFCVYTDDIYQSVIEKYGHAGVLFKIVIAILPIYILQTISNIVLIKELFLKKRFKIFTLAIIIYWLACYEFLGWYFEFSGIGKFRLVSLIGTFGNSTGIYFLHLFIQHNIREGRKELANTQLELDMLKQQLNPHFLLNAMNNLYGEALSNPENTAERILNLSKLLRYQVEASKKDLVILTDELKFLKQYIDYYKFRNERLVVKQSYTGNMNTVCVPPLLFMSLVENAVKFSCETENPYIVFEFCVEDNTLSFTIQNNFLDEELQNTGTRIGLSNLERRLEVYGCKHKFTYYKENELFIAKLNIWELSTVVLS